MEPLFYSIEKGEKWLTPFEKRLWREKFKALQNWFDKKGIEFSPWLQVRLRELLIITFFIKRLEEELLLSSPMPQCENEKGGVESCKKSEKMSSAIQNYEVLCKYFERQRKLVQELEGLKPLDVKISPMSIAELVQDLMHCARELDKGNGKVQEEAVKSGVNHEVILNCDM